ncbi:MAG: isocitrate/isopropylmalate family dehydrogenase [Alphaproteobacteria bacterium]
MPNKLTAPPLVYISGEEMTREVMKMIISQWIDPYLDTSNWQFFDLSCQSRDDTQDKVLEDAIAAGARIGAIFKEPTITPNAEQVKQMGLSKSWGSPNGVMRKGWNGFSIDRDTISVKGLDGQMGYAKQVLFCRHAVGGQYGASSGIMGPGSLKMIHTDPSGKETLIDTRTLKDKQNACVMYHNPYDNLEKLAHHFFQRALNAGATPYVVTKKTVFKWQEPFWQRMSDVFEQHYKQQFLDKGLLEYTGGKLRHLLSDDAVMKMAAWKQGGFAMVSHNYDGDVLTDLLAQIYKSPGFISSVLTGYAEDGRKIMEFEASHGTIADQYAAHLAGKETSVNPLGMVYALRGALDHSVNLASEKGEIRKDEAAKLHAYAACMYDSMCAAMADGKGTRDLCGPDGLTTGQFVAEVARRMENSLPKDIGKVA